MLHLASATDASWAKRAATDIAALLIDHAHLEKKAASAAITLIFKYPDRVPLVTPLSRLAREELQHFELVVEHLYQRGIKLQRLTPAPYAARLHEVLRPNDPERLLDQLLVCAVIEARSCERMRLLADHLEAERAEGASWVDESGSDLVRLYRGLLAAEARHHRLYVDIAEDLFPARIVADRLSAIATHEAKILADAPIEPRLHSG